MEFAFYPNLQEIGSCAIWLLVTYPMVVLYMCIAEGKSIRLW